MSYKDASERAQVNFLLSPSRHPGVTSGQRRPAGPFDQL